MHDSDLERIKANVRLRNREVRNVSRKHGRAIGTLQRVVYVGDDSTAQYELQNELSTGMTVSEMRKISKLEYDIMMLKMAGRQRKRNR